MFEPLAQIGPYKILAKLGEGGMGVVYKADDQRLHRTVALKVIRESGDHESLKKRFLREARAAASIDHPNICRVYDIGEADGFPFLVMELLEGESLAARLSRGPVPLVEAVDVTLSVLSALAALHRCSTLHRDLKPSNVFLSTHGVKLLDFGLAKPVAEVHNETPTETELTNPGMIVGTPRYASPEQISGKALDVRSDLFSAATVLFEMLVGKPAFSGSSPLEIFHSILYDSPPALTGSAAASAIDRVLHRALAKKPEERYSDADGMATELRAARGLEHTSSVEARPVKRLIILPFKPLRPDPETDFLAFSLPDAIAASLAGLSSLVVRSTLLAARFSGAAPDLKEIAKEADVDVVLTGTLLRAGTQLRLATQLVAAPVGTLIWSGSLQVELRDIFQLQDTLVGSVVESLALPLTAGERRLLAHDAPADASAYDLYLQANELARQRKYLEAMAMLRKCVEVDPGYAPAWARLGRSIWLADKYSGGSTERQAEADRAMRRALELNPDLPLAHNLYAMVQAEQGHAHDAMVRLVRRARTTGNDPELFAALAHACRYCGLFDASLAAHRRARHFDPHVATTVTQTYFLSGDYPNALATSDDVFGYGKGVSLAMLGRVDEAIDLLRSKESSITWRLGQLHLISLRASLEKNREECARAADDLLAAGFSDPEGWYYLCRQLAYVGETGRALESLARCVDGGYFCFPALVSDPWLAGLRGNSDFERVFATAKQRCEAARSAFEAESGPQLLGMVQRSVPPEA
ncbi:MAG TPA: protein kinase [Bryobacteraceae bacterium]|nr:protein kinase [Bryobacteraceae bacterium]